MDQHQSSQDLPTINLFGLPLVNASIAATLDWLAARIASGSKAHIAFINAHCVNQLGNAEYRAALTRTSLLLPDGSGIAIAALMQGRHFEANLNGTDLTPLLCQRLAVRQGSVFLLGAAPGVAETAAEKLAARFPGLRIAGTQHGYFAPAQEAAIIETINAARPDLLLVAFGVPKQEIWSDRNLDRLNVKLIMDVGALLDFIAARVPRAPAILRRFGLEWCYRLAQEPRRLWQRYLIGNVTFLVRAVMEAMKQRSLR
jgi:N-acetylglucosaminyldiphosphoundecaprenol N-acetyl-beta-D-mannosaminyltransferase